MIRDWIQSKIKLQLAWLKKERKEREERDEEEEQLNKEINWIIHTNEID